MINALQKLFQSPVFEDEEKTRSAYYINAIVLISIPVIALFFVARVAQGYSPLTQANIILLLLLTALITVWLLVKNGL